MPWMNVSEIEPNVAGLSASEQENLDRLAAAYERDDASVSGMQLAIERISAFFGSPAYFASAIAFIAGWIAVNCLGVRLGWTYVDRPPFFWLQGIASANALLLTIAVLIRQNRMAQQAGHRAHLDLQINLLTEQKVTKVLQLLRRPGDVAAAPATASDREAAELAKPADPEAMLKAIKNRDDATR